MIRITEDDVLILREFGIPEDTIQKVRHREYPGYYLIMYGVVPLTSLLLIFALGFVYIEWLVFQIQNNLQSMRLENTSFYAYDDMGEGIHSLLLLFVGIFLSAWPAYSITLRFYHFNEYVAIRSLIEANSFSFYRSIVRNVIERIEPGNENNYFHEINRGFRRIFMKRGAWLSMLVVAFAAFDFNYYSFITSSRIEYSRYWSTEVIEGNLSQTPAIDVGCRVVDDEPSLSYFISLGDDFSINLFQMRFSGEMIDSIIEFDKILSDLNIPKSRLWMEGDFLFKARYAYDDRCPAAVYRDYGVETGQAIMNILTPDEEPSDLLENLH